MQYGRAAERRISTRISKREKYSKIISRVGAGKKDEPYAGSAQKKSRELRWGRAREGAWTGGGWSAVSRGGGWSARAAWRGRGGPYNRPRPAPSFSRSRRRPPCRAGQWVRD